MEWKKSMLSYFFYCYWKTISFLLADEIKLYSKYKDEWINDDANHFEKMEEWKLLIDNKINEYKKAGGKNGYLGKNY